MNDTTGENVDPEAFRMVHRMVGEKKALGWRMVCIIPRDNMDGTIDLIYTFDDGGGLKTMRFKILPEQEVDSVQDIFLGAGYMEGECVDLFGLRYKGVAPGLLLDAGRSPNAPLRKKAEGTEEKNEQV